jgi:lipopolysaccharide/colanic/teichoic acid biosynthesis glycosyltransferase
MNLASHFASPQMIPIDQDRVERLYDWASRYQRAATPRLRRWRRIHRRGKAALHIAPERAYRVSKRAVDILASSSLMILFSPLMLLVALAIKLTDGGPVLFWQKRVGIWGETFDFPKFRSMVIDADQMVDKLMDHNHHGDSITFKIKRDPRVTWIGRIVRRFSIDEFPQLLCVLRGQMSMVGPRPALTREVDNYSQEHRRRLGVRPGMTCIWQVSGRADLPFDRQVEMDVAYVESHNFWLDLKLVVSTVPAVISGRGAY